MNISNILADLDLIMHTQQPMLSLLKHFFGLNMLKILRMVLEA